MNYSIKIFWLFIFLIIALLLNGCGTKFYYEPVDKRNTAQLQLSLLSKSGGMEKMPTYPYVYVATQAECKKALLLNHDFDHFFLEGNPPQFQDDNRWRDFIGYRIKAGEPTVVIGSSRVQTGHGGNVTYFKKCTGRLKFTPETGKTYRFFYDGGQTADSSCSVGIREVDKNNDVETLLPVSGVTDQGFDCP